MKLVQRSLDPTNYVNFSLSFVLALKILSKPLLPFQPVAIKAFTEFLKEGVFVGMEEITSLISSQGLGGSVNDPDSCDESKYLHQEVFQVLLKSC